MRTAMHWAAELGHVNVIECLIDFGADAKVVECNGRSGLHLAARSGHVEVLRALVEGMTPEQKEEAVNATDNFGVTPLFLAIQKGEDGMACFQFLMELGARYNKTPSRNSHNGMVS